MIVKVGEIHFATMESHLNGCATRKTDSSPSEDFFVAMELENAL